MKTAHFSMRLERKQLAALERIAKEQERPVSWVVSKAIDQYVREHDKQVTEKSDVNTHSS
jgi:predicted transcriptional regulator